MEIKVRAWDYISKQMVYGVAISENGEAILPNHRYSIFSPPIIRMSQPMLYTGLKDINGADIYEGDYVGVHDSDYKGTVYWDDDFLAWAILGDDGKKLLLFDIVWIHGQFLVIQPENVYTKGGK